MHTQKERYEPETRDAACSRIDVQRKDQATRGAGINHRILVGAETKHIPLLQEIAIGIDHVRLAELTLNESHYTWQVRLAEVWTVHNLPH